MKIDGLGIADLPVMPSANDDDLLLIVQNNALKLQSYKNLTGTYSAISGSFEVDGIALPMVDASSVPPTDELVLIVENNGLAVKQVGIGAPSMPVGSFIDVDGVQIPSVRFSGNIDGDELCVAIRNNNTCLIPIPLSFSVGALPTSGRLLFAPLKSSLVLSEGTGSPTFTRATKSWGFNELGYLKELSSGCAFFGGARLVRNTIRTTSEDFSNVDWNKSGMTVSGTNNIICSNTSDVKQLSQAATGSQVLSVGQLFAYGFRLRRVVNGASFVQITANSNGYGTEQYCNVSLLDWRANAVGCTCVISPVSENTADVIIRVTCIASGTHDRIGILFANSLEDLRLPVYVGDGIKSFDVLRAWSVDVTGYAASYIPEYVSVGVVSSPFFGAGIDGAKYYETDWQGAPIPAANLLGFKRENAATNNLLHCRDLSNAAWSTKTNITANKTATGLDGIANTATTLTATATDAIILQPITLASAARCASAYVKRRTGTGTISFTQDGGSSWTDITSQINSSTWSRVQITSTLANPSVGFKISTSGDAIDVDCVQNEAGAVATSPIVTTTSTVTRNAESLTYQTAGNWSDTAGTLYFEVEPYEWKDSRAIGTPNGAYLYNIKSGIYTWDGSTPAYGPDGVPSGRKKLAMRWSTATSKQRAASSGAVGTLEVAYDGSWSLTAIAILSVAAGYVGNVAIYNYAMTDVELQGITA